MLNLRKSLSTLLPALPLAMLGMAATLPASAAAQQAVTSRPVVQPLPPQEVEELKDVLRALDRSPRNVDALLNAGYASIKVGDLEAAMGYFGRAEEAAPGDARVKQAQATVFLRSGRPVEALDLFAQAEIAGTSQRTILSDRGLAYDMVGDQVRAQAYYREALREKPGDGETVRRLAVSQAIAGNETAFLETLRPLVDQKDFPAFRAQAFGLAILGENARAKDVTEAVMPSDLANRIVPYLSYMPRLTKAQQAAAANLGIFPKAADIGREDPRIAQYVSGSSTAASTALARGADTRLEPAGEPLGARPEPVRVTEVNPAPVIAAPVPVAVPVAVPAPVAVAVPVPVPVPPPAVTTVLTKPEPKPDPSFADAFADMGTADPARVGKPSDAVDLSAIDIPREAAPKPVAKAPAAPAPKVATVPERFWVQLGTGGAADPLKYDWRRLTQRVPDLLSKQKGYTVAFGSQFRLLTGPYPTKAKRDEALRALSDKGLGVLPFTSPEGMEVQELK